MKNGGVLADQGGVHTDLKLESLKKSDITDAKLLGGRADRTPRRSVSESASRAAILSGAHTRIYFLHLFKLGTFDFQNLRI